MRKQCNGISIDLLLTAMITAHDYFYHLSSTFDHKSHGLGSHGLKLHGLLTLDLPVQKFLPANK